MHIQCHFAFLIVFVCNVYGSHSDNNIFILPPFPTNVCLPHLFRYVSDETNSDPFVAWVTDVANTVNPPLVNSMSWGSIEQVSVVCSV